MVSSELEEYCSLHSTEEPQHLKKIVRDTHLYQLKPRMLSGHLQGRLLSLISKLIQPTTILDIGSFTGYSAICMAEGLKDNGQVFTLEANLELEKTISSNIKVANLESKITLLMGEALETIKNLDKTFDIVFIDADKLNYKAYYDNIFNKVAIGGLIITDNILWSGKVIDTTKTDKTTTYLREFNKKLSEDSRTEKLILPIRDGLFVSRKIKE